jgi:hypothetical protein
MTTSVITPKEIMTAKFLPNNESIKIASEPSLMTMFPIHKHMAKCARTYQTPLCNVNVIFLVLNENLFEAYSQEDYPTKMEHYPELDPFPNYNNALDSNARQALKDENAYDNMIHFDCKNLNAALIARFLKYLNPTYREQFDNHCIKNGISNPTYLACWQ